jgi:hypothetical protein
LRKTIKCLVKALQTLVPADIRVCKHLVMIAQSANDRSLKFRGNLLFAEPPRSRING